nr:cycloartenol-C-24-methyltransferase [Tanacetum cinerariifolium]
MSKAGAFDLATGLGGKIEKDDVLSAVDKYEKYHSDFGGVEEDRKANYTDMGSGLAFCWLSVILILSNAALISSRVSATCLLFINYRMFNHNS